MYSSNDPEQDFGRNATVRRAHERALAKDCENQHPARRRQLAVYSRRTTSIQVRRTTLLMTLLFVFPSALYMASSIALLWQLDAEVSTPSTLRDSSSSDNSSSSGEMDGDDRKSLPKDNPLENLAMNKTHQENTTQNEYAVPCRYDGHCPIGTTCGVKPSPTTKRHEKQDPDWWPGICQPFPILPGAKPSQLCVDRCRAELEMDEHFFHESVPVIQHEYATHDGSRPLGCMLDFLRRKETSHDILEKWGDLHGQDGINIPAEEPQPSIVSWERNRFRHVIRVDPILDDGQAGAPNNQLQRVTWRAYCFSPCQHNDDCAINAKLEPSNSDRQGSPAFVCLEGACQRNVDFWEASSTLDQGESIHADHANRRNQNEKERYGDRAVLVTAANEGYARGLQNFVASAEYWAPNHDVVVYNLGGLNVTQVESWSNVIDVQWKEEGIPKDKYPPHMYKFFATCAWKPIIIQETLKKYKMIFWLDAGSTLAGPLTPMENIVKRNGLFLVKGQDDDMKPMSHSDTYSWFGFDKNSMNVGPHFGGGTQGHIYPSRYVESIVKKNAACAMDPACIVPTKTKNPYEVVTTLKYHHRFDQTSLSICAYHPLVMAPHHTEYVAASGDAVSQVRTAASYKFVWTSRQSCLKYISLRTKFREENKTFNYIENGVIPVDWKRIDNSNRNGAPVWHMKQNKRGKASLSISLGKSI